MLRHVPAIALTVLALAACNREPAPTPAERPAAAPEATVTPPAPVSAPAPAPVAGPVKKGASFVGFDGARFGMSAQDLRQAWNGELKGAAPADSGACYMLSPASAKSPRDFALMVEGDKFVRYDVGTDAETAPGGGKVGMSADQIRSLYTGRVREQPAKYVPGAVDLRVGADDDSGSALVFETDADGKVTAWRVGQAPAIDYVEGCS